MPFSIIVALTLAVGTCLVLLQSWVRQRRYATRLNAQLVRNTQDLQDSEQRRRVMFATNPFPMWV